MTGYIGDVFRVALLSAKWMKVAHPADSPDLSERALKLFVDSRILVFVLQLRPALLDALSPGSFHHFEKGVVPIVPTKRQVTHRFSATVEVVVKPELGRYHQAPWFPIHPHPFFFPLLPKQGITLTAENENVGARAMEVGLLVCPWSKPRNMGRHNLAGQIKFHIAGALSSLTLVI